MSEDKKKNSGSLADQLGNLDIEVSEKSDDDQDRRPNDPSDNAPPPESGPDASQGPWSTYTGEDEKPQDLSDEELFRQSVENLDPDDIPPDGDVGPEPARSSSEPTSGRSDESRADRSHDNPSAPGDDGSSEPAPLTEKQLFEQAVDNMDPSRIYDAKFRGQAGADLPQSSDSSEPADGAGSPAQSQPAEKEVRQQAQHLQDHALFERHVGSVTPLEDRDKYYHARPQRTSQSDDDDSPDDNALITPSLPQSGKGLNHIAPLDRSQQALLDRHQRFANFYEVPELNIRGLTRKKAVAQLSEFIERHAGKQTQFVRIIPGRGLRSDGPPVLKPAVLKWLEGPGLTYLRGYAPERTHAGDYGSLIVEMIPE